GSAIMRPIRGVVPCTAAITYPKRLPRKPCAGSSDTSSRLVCPIESLVVRRSDEGLGWILNRTSKCHRVLCADMGIKRTHISKTFDQLEMVGDVEPRHQQELPYPRLFAAVGNEIQDRLHGLVKKVRD